MTDRRVPPPLADDDDEEDTLIDLSVRGAEPDPLPGKPPARTSARASRNRESTPAPSAVPAPARPLPRPSSHSLVGDDDDDEDATELMLPGRSPHIVREIHAGGGVLPLVNAVDAATTVRLEAPPSITDEPLDGPVFKDTLSNESFSSSSPSSGAPSDRAPSDGGRSKELVSREALFHDTIVHGPAFKDSLDGTPPVRPLEALPPIDLDDASDDLTLSSPRVVRMTFGREEPPPGPPVDVKPTDSALRGRSLLRAGPEGALGDDASSGAELPGVDVSGDELPDDERGTLVVEAPADAVVFVDGVQRGRGTQQLAGLDRYARVAVRIHCPGHEPWSALVSLNGMALARVTPTLKRR